MGSDGKAPIIGYRYFLGLHFVLCLGPIDALKRIEVDQKTAWQGGVASGRLVMDAPELFGGKTKEGGVSGFVDVLSGHATQPVNDYLNSGWLSGLVPAFRRVCSVVLRQCYIGNNPYLKPWAFEAQRVYMGDGGAAQWYPEKAGIEAGFGVGDAAIYIALDGSGSMSGARMAAQKTAVADMLAEIRDTSTRPNDIRIVLWTFDILASIERRDASADDYDDLIAWVNALSNTAAGGTDFNTGVSQAEAFFLGGPVATFGDKLRDVAPDRIDYAWGQVGAWTHSGEELAGSGTKRRIIVFVTDGAPSHQRPTSVADAIVTLAKVSNVEVFGFNIADSDTQYTAQLDNTPDDGVPVVAGGDSSALRDAFANAFASGLDMNPAHILREVLIARDTGGDGDETKIGASFADAADQLFTERFGLSLHWQNPRDRASFKEIVERHIDASVFVNRATGQWDVKLIRDDYDVEDLPVFDRSNVLEWRDIDWPDPAGLPNQITLTYTDRAKYDAASITLTNPARVLSVGSVINRKVGYEGINRADLAAQVAARDLRALSNPLLTGAIRAARVPLDINIGSAILLNNERMGIVGVVARVVELVEGDGRDNSVEIRFVQDKFAFGADILVAAPAPVGPGVVAAPAPLAVRLVEEAPYYELARAFGDDDAQARLAANPEAGWLNMSGAGASGDTIDAIVTVDAGGGYFDKGAISLATSATLLSSLTGAADDVVVLVPRNAELATVRVGSLASIGNEYVRVDAIEPVCTMFGIPRLFAREKIFAEGARLVLGRGCLDTVPAAHAAGAAVLFWSDSSGSDEIEYAAGEVVDVKLRPRTGAGALKVSKAPVDSVTFAQRAQRPYPAGKLQADGVYGGAVFDGSVTLTWAHRDRLTQTTAVYDDHTAGNIGPEAGVVYVLIVDAVDSDGNKLHELHRRWMGQATSAVVSDADFAQRLFEVPLFQRGRLFLGTRLFPEKLFDMGQLFRGITPATAALECRVEARRGELTSWQVPAVRVAVFRAPINLTIEEI